MPGAAPARGPASAGSAQSGPGQRLRSDSWSSGTDTETLIQNFVNSLREPPPMGINHNANRTSQRVDDDSAQSGPRQRLRSESWSSGTDSDTLIQHFKNDIWDPRSESIGHTSNRTRQPLPQRVDDYSDYGEPEYGDSQNESAGSSEMPVSSSPSPSGPGHTSEPTRQPLPQRVDDDSDYGEPEYGDSQNESSGSSEMPVSSSSSPSGPSAKRRKTQSEEKRGKAKDKGKAEDKGKGKDKAEDKTSKRNKRKDIPDNEREMRDAIKRSARRVLPDTPRYSAVSHPLMTRRPAGWREDVDEPIVEQQFNAEKGNWLSKHNWMLHYQLYRFCLNSFGCLPFDIFLTERRLRTERRKGRPYFSPSPDDLKCLCRVVVHPFWPEPSPDTYLVLALQFAAILRTNDRRPWSYIHEVVGLEEFLRRMSEILRQTSMPARELVETTRQDFLDRRSNPGFTCQFFIAVALVFDEQQEETGDDLPAPKTGDSAPETYESLGADWMLIDRALGRISNGRSLNPITRNTEDCYQTGKATRLYTGDISNKEAEKFAEGSIMGIMRDRRARSLAAGQGNNDPLEQDIES